MKKILLFVCSVYCVCVQLFAETASEYSAYNDHEFLGLSVGISALYSTQRVEVSEEVKATCDYLRLMWNKTADRSVSSYGDHALVDASYSTAAVVKEWNADIAAYKKALADMVLLESVRVVDVAVKDNPSRDRDLLFDKDDIAFKRFVRVANKDVTVGKRSAVAGANLNLTYRFANRGEFVFGAEIDCSFTSRGRKGSYAGLPVNGSYKLYELETFAEKGDARDPNKLRSVTEMGDISALNKKELGLAQVGGVGVIMGVDHDSVIAGIYDFVPGGTILSSDSKELAGTLSANGTGGFEDAVMTLKRGCFTPSVGFVVGYKGVVNSLIEIGVGLTRVGANFCLSGKDLVGNSVVLEGNLRKIAPSFKLSYTNKISEKLSTNISVRYILKAKKDRFSVKNNVAIIAGINWKFI